MISPAPLVDPAVLARCVRLGALLDRLHAAQQAGWTWALASSWCAAGGPDPAITATVVAWIGRGGKPTAALKPFVGTDFEDVLRRAAAAMEAPS